MEQLAAAIVGALVAGAGKVTDKVVHDAYASAKFLLKSLIPRFDASRIESASESELVDELSVRLQGLTEEERMSLAAELAALATTAGASREAEELGKFYKYQIARNEAGEDISVALDAEGSHNISDNKAGGSVTVRTGSKN